MHAAESTDRSHRLERWLAGSICSQVKMKLDLEYASRHNWHHREDDT